MPTKVYLDGNSSVTLKGDSQKTAFYYGPPVLRWFKRHVRAIAMNGHVVEILKRRVLCYEYQEEAEHQAELAQQQKAAEDAAMRSKCRKCGMQNPPEFDFCGRCAQPLVKKDPTPKIPKNGDN